MPAGYWVRRQDVSVGPSALKGVLSIPDDTRGLVVVVDVNPTGECSRCNARSAAALHSRRWSTLLIDLACQEKGAHAHALSNERLSSRVVEAVLWVARDERMAKLPIGLLGANSGSPAVLAAAAEMPRLVSTIVCHDGKPDLAGRELAYVRVPTLLVTGEWNAAGIASCRAAYARLTCLKQFVIIPGAKRVCDDKRGQEKMIDAGAHWFDLYLLSRRAVEESVAGKRTHPAI
jgi:hypothetical protein